MEDSSFPIIRKVLTTPLGFHFRTHYTNSRPGRLPQGSALRSWSRARSPLQSWRTQIGGSLFSAHLRGMEGAWWGDRPEVGGWERKGCSGSAHSWIEHNQKQRFWGTLKLGLYIQSPRKMKRREINFHLALWGLTMIYLESYIILN